MAATSSLDALQNTGVRTIKPFTLLNTPSLLNRINWAFVFYIGFFTAGISYCLYNLSLAYLLRSHSPFALKDELKLVKCQALLLEVKEKDPRSDEVQLLLQECRGLLASIKDPNQSYERKALYLELALYYATDNPHQSYSTAQELSSSHALFEVAKTIQKKHPHFDRQKLDLLFCRAFEAGIDEDRTSSSTHIPTLYFGRLLEFATAFQAVGNFDAGTESYSLHSETECLRRATKLANTYERLGSKLGAFCQLAEYYHKIEDLAQMRSSLESAEALLKDITGTDRIRARLTRAETFFSIEEFARMDQELDEVVSAIQENPLATTTYLYPLASLLARLAKNEKTQSRFKSVHVIEPCITDALEALRNPSAERPAPEDQIDAYFNLAYVYQNKFLENSAMEKGLVESAFKVIQALPETTEAEIDAKIIWLGKILYFLPLNPAIGQQVLHLLEGIYDRYRVDNSNGCRKKTELGRNIVMSFSCSTPLPFDTLRPFFQKYLRDLHNSQNEEIFQKAVKLALYEPSHPALKGYYPLEAAKAQLEAAEALLPQLTSIQYPLALAQIIKGYLKVDREKSLQWMEHFQNQQAKYYLITALAIPALMGALYYYPPSAIAFSLAFSIVPLFNR